jgi:uncharacterized repeat protein (TIGR03803 family)
MDRISSGAVCAHFWAFTFTILVLSASAFGQTEKVLYEFTGFNGSSPVGNLVFDASGNLYGTTTAGGSESGEGHGVVYELSPAEGGGWTETVLYAFTGGDDGSQPLSGLVFDASGNLYGTTGSGGAFDYGTVFELSPVTGGGWIEQVLYSFSNSSDGATPIGPLVFDTVGNLYGTCNSAGPHGQGVVFELSPGSGRGWAYSVILAGSQAHGGALTGGAVFDDDGNLYATAAIGGPFSAGAIYRLRYTAGDWKAALIYTFQGGTDGAAPISGLTYRAPNRFFGVTNLGGSFGYGTAFELTFGSDGTWSKSILHDFGDSSANGLPPIFSLTIGPSGQLYGATDMGGSGHGTTFALVESGGAWRERILHNFTISSDAGNPNGNVVLDGAGNLYGVGYNGGASGAGAVYEITP